VPGPPSFVLRRRTAREILSVASTTADWGHFFGARANIASKQAFDSRQMPPRVPLSPIHHPDVPVPRHGRTPSARNSPPFTAGDVETPLLIIHGDMDYVPIQQGEQFFSALYRRGKRARFVRYRGEGHLLQSPANIHDMWQHIFRWLDEFLS